jgi:hypothetical protein
MQEQRKTSKALMIGWGIGAIALVVMAAWKFVIR